MKNQLEWIRSDQKLPKPDVLVWVAVGNKKDGIWLHDICWHTGTFGLIGRILGKKSFVGHTL